MSTTSRQDENFKKIIGEELPKSLLQTAIDWIRDSMSPETVFEPEKLKKFIGDTCTPAEVFSDDELNQWALDNGFVMTEAKEKSFNKIKELFG